MKKYILISLIIFVSSNIWAQHKASLKITEIHVDLNGKEISVSEEMEFSLTDHIQSVVFIFDQGGVKYGVEYQYKKGENRIKLVRRGFAIKNGTTTIFGKKQKDMQEIKTSIPGSLSMRHVDNIILNKEKLEAINASFKYELIYK